MTDAFGVDREEVSKGVPIRNPLSNTPWKPVKTLPHQRSDNSLSNAFKGIGEKIKSNRAADAMRRGMDGAMPKPPAAPAAPVAKPVAPAAPAPKAKMSRRRKAAYAGAGVAGGAAVGGGGYYGYKELSKSLPSALRPLANKTTTLPNGSQRLSEYERVPDYVFQRVRAHQAGRDLERKVATTTKEEGRKPLVNWLWGDHSPMEGTAHKGAAKVILNQNEARIAQKKKWDKSVRDYWKTHKRPEPRTVSTPAPAPEKKSHKVGLTVAGGSVVAAGGGATAYGVSRHNKKKVSKAMQDAFGVERVSKLEGYGWTSKEAQKREYKKTRKAASPFRKGPDRGRNARNVFGGAALGSGVGAGAGAGLGAMEGAAPLGAAAGAIGGGLYGAAVGSAFNNQRENNRALKRNLKSKDIKYSKNVSPWTGRIKQKD